MGSKNVELEEEKEKSAVLMIERTSLSTTVHNRAAVAEGEASHKIGGWTRVKEKRTKEEEDAGGTHSILYSKSDTTT